MASKKKYLYLEKQINLLIKNEHLKIVLLFSLPSDTMARYGWPGRACFVWYKLLHKEGGIIGQCYPRRSVNLFVNYYTMLYLIIRFCMGWNSLILFFKKSLFVSLLFRKRNISFLHQLMS